MIVDCHVNIWEAHHLRPRYAEQIARARPEGAVGLEADADTLYREMAAVDRAIIFALRYGDSAGVESNDETCAAAVAKYPDKFVGFAYCDPRRADCMDLLTHAIEDLGQFCEIHRPGARCERKSLTACGRPQSLGVPQMHVPEAVLQPIEEGVHVVSDDSPMTGVDQRADVRA